PAQELVQEQESPANQLLTAQPIQDSPASAEVLKQDLSKETARQPPLAPNGQREKSRESRLPRRARVQEISAGSNEIIAALPRREIVTSEIIPEMKGQVSQEAITQASGLATEAGIAPGNGKGKQSQAPQSTENAEELFAENGSDRSPQAWLARLIRQAERERIQTKTTYGSTPPATNTPATSVAGKAGRLVQQRRTEPVSQQTRTFLKPLVGIDPDEVPIYRDGQAAQLTGELDADALSNGQSIEIAPGYTEHTPEALGLLAHELTHVVRRQRPRFIPPVVKAQTAPGEQRQTPGLELLNEEDLALQVEQQVRRVARAVSEDNTPAPRGPEFPAHAPEGEQVTSPGEIGTERGIWGNLPAPWEPLPAWLTNTPSPAPMSPVPPTIQIISPPTVTWQAPRAGLENTGQTFGETGIRRASAQRNVNEPDEEGNTSAQQASEQTVPAQPEADLDALARQVYNLLKRRLSVEQRRVL
ncbi:MAG TPA: DUF4157 domain-containing protein, partial [Ktedonobacteraceae bacterium]|nr:DUF4157 domain-containing protein [Ktedonobacteraceae bacterium]